VNELLGKLSQEEISKEIGRFIDDDPLQEDDELRIWVIRINERDVNERTVELDEFPNVLIHLTFVPPRFFSDVIRHQPKAPKLDYESELDSIPFWQMATVVRVLGLARPILDPDEFITQHIKAARNISWDPALITEKRAITLELVKKAKHFAFDEDMLADAYIWAIKAAEEAICVLLMEKNLFSITSPPLLLDTLRKEPILYEFYIQLLNIDLFTHDLALIALKELEKLAEHLYRANETTPRATWILGAFVSVNHAERILTRIYSEAGKIDSLELQYQLEEAIAELWHSFWLLAQTQHSRTVPLDPWVVGLFWKWFVNQGSDEGLEQILSSVERILTTSGLKDM